MKLLTEGERKILRKFKGGSDVSSETDEVVLNRYASIGFVQFGFDWDNMVETAKLTDSGVKHLER
ncbi:MAG: hypothetical protein O8C67_12440 [Candidatus Methanoperedens sp.]|nr:hypothetical protein [Candidatus Methanoperedens sp.]